MKRLKLGIITTIMMCLLVNTNAIAEIRVNSPDIITPRTGQNRFIKDEKGYHDAEYINVDTSGKHGVEVKTEDEVDMMTWDAAVIAAKKHGEGWRLPTITELHEIYEQREMVGGFGDEDYWSSTEQDVNSAWIQGFRMGDQDRYNKQSKLKVRAVRSF